MKKFGILGSIAAVSFVLVLAGCSAPVATEPSTEALPETVEMPTPTPTPTPTPILFEWVEFPPYPEGGSQTDAQGNTIKQVGVTAGLHNADDVPMMKWLVRGITVDPECTNPGAMAPENGHFVRVDIQGEAYPELAAEAALGGIPAELFMQTWEATDTNGVLTNGQTVTQSSISCLTPGELIDVNLEPGQRAVGSVVLDLPITTGTITMLISGNGGWSYPLQ